MPVHIAKRSEQVPNYFKFWGKARKDSPSFNHYHLLPYHSLDVAVVANSWWAQSPSIRNAFKICTGLPEHEAKGWVLFFIALHDYGKWDLRFQRKAYEVWLEVNPELGSLNLPLSEHAIKNYLHGPEGFTLFYQDNEHRFPHNDWLNEDDKKWAQWQGWISAVAGHHGHIPESHIDESHLPSPCKAAELPLKEARLEWIEVLEILFLHPAGLNLDNDPPMLERQNQVMLAGFCSVCDWLGSSHYFPYDTKPQITVNTLRIWYQQRSEYANQALTAAGVLSCIKAGASVEKLLADGKQPRQVQCLLDQLPLMQTLTLIEASTGSGKTEAALAYAWKLLEQGLADSIVFALPTQATANAMFSRLERAADAIFQHQTNLVLAHGRAKYQEAFINLKQAIKPQTHQGAEEAWVQCAEWLAQSRKRVFLGQIGVCTVDQVLVSVLPIRHKFVRGFGIGRSVLIIDEVHAYDSYMYGLLAGVLQQQKAAGGSAILLSATLPTYQKQALADAWQCEPHESMDHRYPLITSCHKGLVQTFDLENHPDQKPTEHQVKLELCIDDQLCPNEALMQRIVQAVMDGAQVCVVCNLVDVAQNLYQMFEARFSKSPLLATDQINLFHSRYTFLDRQRKEQAVLDTFGATPKPNNAREKGHLLIATQVVEQSLDVDFDWLITQLCPVDLLFQRMGRLHRHERKRPCEFEARVCTVLVPDSLNYQLHELIYGNSRVLWRTHQLLKEASAKEREITFPSAYREWIEPVYQNDRWQDEPEEITASFDAYSEEAFAAKCNAKQLMNASMNPLSDDDSTVSVLTRDGEMSLSIVPYWASANGGRILLSGADLNELDDSERFEAINVNTIPVPSSWGKKSGQLPEPDQDGLIWLEMTDSGQTSCLIADVSYFYDRNYGFKRQGKDFPCRPRKTGELSHSSTC